MNTIDGIIEDLELEDSCVGGCTTKGEIIECLENLKILQKEKETVLQALEDVRAEIAGNLEAIIGKYDSNTKPENMPTRKIERNNGRTEAIDIINRKIKEFKHES